MILTKYTKSMKYVNTSPYPSIASYMALIICSFRLPFPRWSIFNSSSCDHICHVVSHGKHFSRVYSRILYYSRVFFFFFAIAIKSWHQFPKVYRKHLPSIPNSLLFISLLFYNFFLIFSNIYWIHCSIETYCK